MHTDASERILVVDDDPALREVAATLLSQAGHETITASDGMRGWELLKAQPFDLALIDLDMPHVDGLTLIEWVKADPSLRHLPIIVVTSHDHQEAIDRAFRTGASLFAPKPVNWALLLHQLRYVVRASLTERKLFEAKDQAERAARLKNGFMSIISHELRTPLTHIIGFAEVLQQQSFGPIGSERYQEYVDEIAGAGRNLLDTVTGIILLSRGLAGELEIREGEYEVAQILRGLAPGLEAKAAGHGVDVVLLDAYCDTSLYCDMDLIMRSLNALLDNAIKFSDPGSKVTVDCAVTPDGGFLFSVGDEGPGMTEQQIAECSEPFVQCDMSIGRMAEGIGLGLAFARTLIELHGGSLRLASGGGRGTTATLALPVERVLCGDTGGEAIEDQGPTSLNAP